MASGNIGLIQLYKCLSQNKKRKIIHELYMVAYKLMYQNGNTFYVLLSSMLNTQK